MSDPTLGDKQRLFYDLFLDWALWARERGYKFTFGEAKRSNEQAEINAIGRDGREQVALLVGLAQPRLATALRDNGKNNGIRNSAHLNQLALDLNAFKDGIYLTQTEQWRALGEHWESLHPLNRWGGRFNDGNHISMEHNGIK